MAASNPLSSEGDRSTIPDSHPLRHLFQQLVAEHFHNDIALRDTAVQQYVADVMTEFCDSRQLFKIRSASGIPLHDVGEMLLEADPVYGEAPSFDRERQVRKHIGDYTLFFTGMFPESINSYRLRRHRLESFIDLVKAGKESYFVVSRFDQFEYRNVAPLFAKLAREFESCVYGLNMVKNELRAMQHSIERATRDLLM